MARRRQRLIKIASFFAFGQILYSFYLISTWLEPRQNIRWNGLDDFKGGSNDDRGIRFLPDLLNAIGNVVNDRGGIVGGNPPPAPLKIKYVGR